jgi:nucleoid-associated protein YgaU
MQSTEQQRGAVERSSSENIEALTTQLAVIRRDLETARTTNARLTETNTALERERTATINQLRQENRAIASRLAQAQGLLDQIASAVRLGAPVPALTATPPPAARVPASPAPPPAAETTPAAAAPRYHTVVEGDSLSRISQQYYGTMSRWQEIFEANRDVLGGENNLRLGQRLRIP